MATFHIENFGCRATQADAAAIERQLLDRGCARSADAAHADVVVVNTCTVTAAADAQARDAVRRIHRASPSARILATGCYAQRAPEELAALPGVEWVVGNSHQTEISRVILPSGSQPGPQPGNAHAESEHFFPLAQLDGVPASLERGPAKILTGDIFALADLAPENIQGGPILGGEGARTRPILKIQDGCNNRCAYCVIPFVRGRSRSLAPARVVDEIRRLTAAGAKEVVLSGINLGSYGRDLTPRAEFGDLLRRIVDETPVERLRLSSIEPMDVTQDFIELLASSGRIAPHFHMPLQSASDRILAAMHRWYRAAHYARRMELIAERLPDAAIGADVIAGFPGETEEDHRRTLDFITALPFTYLHPFAFSKRPGTAGAALADEVPLATIRRRSKELRALGAGKAAAFRAGQAGKTQRVLTLDRSGGDAGGDRWTGALSGNYLNVRVAGRWPANTWLEVRLTAAGEHLLGAQLAAEEKQKM
ncbi:MAG TPA: tRNA (N(6)-L-threonylcarbamoyladenosine(37)-C(2))-methylthiotransferase MtaB [Candidatus Acidoferrum sp.]|nr:tRNA (N(6)-L-threonylcarbamoyladenosine(37)-C(2))-methylthiotransferase MtaB [Candidatus Acidoferrum sp.]